MWCLLSEMHSGGLSCFYYNDEYGLPEQTLHCLVDKYQHLVRTYCLPRRWWLQVPPELPCIACFINYAALYHKRPYILIWTVKYKELKVYCYMEGYWLAWFLYYENNYLIIYTVEPRFTNASHHEQINSGTNFPKKRSRVTNSVPSNKHASWQQQLATSWEYRRESVSCCVTFAQYT
jgi:hypothetical protein